MISHENKCIYIHIPKTAGTSVEKHLGAHQSVGLRLKQDHRTVSNIMGGISPFSSGKVNLRSILVYFNQRYKGALQGVNFVSKRQFDSYFKFCFVRNPWDRTYSWYRNVLRDPLHQKELGISEDITFSDFVTYHANQWALRPQIDWIVNAEGKVIVDYVGKFENLEYDFKVICEHLGLEDSTLPMTLDSGKVTYIDAYDNSLKKLVAERYHKEIKLFNYRFGE